MSLRKYCKKKSIHKDFSFITFLKLKSLKSKQIEHKLESQKSSFFSKIIKKSPESHDSHRKNFFKLKFIKISFFFSISFIFKIVKSFIIIDNFVKLHSKKLNKMLSLFNFI